MKQTIFLTFLVLTCFLVRSQNIESLLTEPQVIALTISTPQPRLNETFQISLDINHLRANIFQSLVGKVQMSDDLSTSDNGEMTLNVNAVTLGKNEIGPLEFYLGKTKYTSNKITYEVIEALPNVDNGIWFRKVMTSDTTFCVIIEQRIPAKSKKTIISDNSTSYSTVPEFTNIVKFKDSYSINGVSGSNSISNTNFSSITVKGEEKKFMYGYSVYHFNIVDRNAKIKITKDKFENLPDNFKFDEISIQ